jgi:hypothetical protein
MLAEIASTPIILVHAYSDDEDTHVKLHRERSGIRKAFIEELVREIVERLKT